MGSLFSSGKIRYVFFGMFNVLVEADLESYQRRAAEIYGCSLEQFQTAAAAPLVKLQAGRMETEEFWEQVGEALKAEGAKDVPARKFKGFMSGMLAESLKVNKEMCQLCAQTKGRCKVGTICNITPEHAKVLHKAGVFEVLNLSILSCQINHRMPEPGFYKRTTRLARSSAKQCLYVDTDQELLAAAEKAGFKTFLHEEYDATRWELLQKGLIG